MRHQLAADLRGGLEGVREHLGPGLQDRVLGVPGVQRHRAVEGVHGRLHGVAHVVRRALAVARRGVRIGLGVVDRLLEVDRLRVGVLGRGRVPVDHPHHLLVHDGGVHLRVQRQERRDLADALLRVAVVEDLRLLVEVVRDHDVRVAELDRVQQLVEEAADGGTAVALEGVVDLLAALLVVRAALLVVELLGIGPLGRSDDRVVRGVATEVDPLLVLAERALAGHARLQEARLAVGVATVAVRGGGAVAVRVGDVLVHPGAVREAELVRPQLAHADHGVLQLTVDLVAVHAEHVVEAPVATVGLALLEGGRDDVGVHQTDLRRGRGVLAQRTRGRVRAGRVGHLGDVVEVERGAGRVDVVLDVGLLERALVGLDLELLDGPGVEVADGQGRQDHQPGADRGDAPVGAEDPHHEQGRDHHRGDREDRLRGQDRVDVRVGGALEAGVGGGQQVVALEPVPRAEEEHVDRGEHAEVAARGARDLEPALLVPAHAAVDEVADQGADDRDQQHELPEGDQHVDHRQGEDVEGDVVAEDRVGLPEVLRVQEQLHVLPATGQREPAEGADHDRRAVGQAAAQRVHRGAELLQRLLLPRDRRVDGALGVRDAEAEEQRHGEHHEAGDEQQRLGDPPRDEHVGELELVHPQVLRPHLRGEDEERDEHAERDHRDHQRGDPPGLAGASVGGRSWARPRHVAELGGETHR